MNKKNNYKNSRKLLRKNKKYISGASTFSKLKHFEEGKTPFALSDAKGAYTWDVDGNKYIDYASCRGYVILGHKFKCVDNAIKEQIKSGIAFSLPHTLEMEVAEMLVNRIPSAEMVRFGKNGNDVTSAAIRLARHVTGKEHFLFSGYHGWQDWYISQTSMSGGIPKSIKKLGHRFTYNDIESVYKYFKEYKGKIAAIIMEPTRFEKPDRGFLAEVKKIAHKNGALLIFDEIVTGFRFHKQGAQKLFGVLPDLSTFGKAMSNGMPISAIVGKGEYMKRFPEVFFSLTSAGEALSLAAAKATIGFFDKNDVCGYLNKIGQPLMEGMDKLIQKYDLTDRMKIVGYPCYNHFLFLDDKNSNIDGNGLMDIFTQKIAQRGILACECHIMNYSHNEHTNKKTLRVYDEVLPLIKENIERNRK